jgi:hypothetical protein
LSTSEVKKMSLVRRIAILGLGVSFSLTCASTGFAQRTTGDISGTVMDTTGAVLPGVSVTAVCTETNLTRTAISDAQGGYSLPELPICLYRVTAELAGFKIVAREAPVTASAVAKTDFRLEVGTVSETVTVEGVSPLIEFSDKLNNRVDSERIQEMPLSGRDFNSLLNIMPGVQHRPGGGFQGVNISGARTSSNNFMIDGISNNDRYYGDTVLNQTAIIGIPATLVPMDAIGELTVQQTPSAEFGVRGGAAVNIVMKSGGNVAHGTGYYFRHDDWTDSPNFFDIRAAQRLGTEADATPIKNQQYGGTFGGPIKKDKAFFFGYYEGQRLAVTTPYDVHVPTDAQISAARARIAAAGLRTNPIGENLIKFYPTDPTGTLHVNGTTVANMNTFSAKVDHQLNASNLINERVFYGRSFQSAPAGNSGEIVPPSAAGPVDLFNSVTDPTLAALTGVVWNSTLSNHTLLETRFGFNYFSQTIEPNNKIDPTTLGINTGPLAAEDLGVPAVTTPFGHIGGIGGYPITTAPTTTLQIGSSLTHTRGSHTMKLGGSWDYGYNRSVRNQARTSLTANGRSSGDVDALVGLLLARFENASRSFGQTERRMGQTSIGVFFNDDWRMTPRLTVSAGLRYEVVGPVNEQDNQATNFFPDRGLVQLGSNGLDQLYKADKNNFGPRAGLAWDPTGSGRTSVRVGYALTYDAALIGTVHPGLFSSPALGVFRVAFAQTPRTVPDAPGVTCLDPNNSTAGGDYVCLQPGVPVFGSSPTGAPPFNIFRVPDDFRSGYYHYFHATMQHEILRNNSVTVSYVGSRGNDLVWRREINAPPLGSATTSADPLRPFFSQFPQYRSIAEFTNDSKSWYDSMQLSFRQNSWHGINTQYNYTLSKCTDYNSGSRDGATEQAMNPYDPSNNEGPCNSDIRHNFNVGGSFAIPHTSGSGGPVQIGAVFTALSGRPYTPGVGTFDQSGQNTGTLRADCLGPAPIYNYDLDYLFPDLNTSLSAVTNAAAAFGTPAPGKLGTCGRNSGRLPTFTQLDLNIIKEFKVQGSKRIQARWEIFNVTNRVNLGGFLSPSIRSASFGKIGSTPDVDRGNPVLGSGGPRAMQWAVKVLF